MEQQAERTVADYLVLLGDCKFTAKYGSWLRYRSHHTPFDLLMRAS